jgi:hypothetical protein
MSEEKTTWGKFQTRSIVREPQVVNVHYSPEAERQMALANVTWGKFQTRSIVGTKSPALQPCLRVTLGLSEEAKLSQDQAMQFGAKLLAAVIHLAPELKLVYSASHSSVAAGRFIARLIPQATGDNVETQLRELIEQLRTREYPEQPVTDPETFQLDYVPVGAN